MNVPSDREMLGQILMGRLASTAAGLQRLADELNAAAAEVPTIGKPGSACATDVARRAVHSVMWGLANASLDGIVGAAADYDRNVKQD